MNSNRPPEGAYWPRNHLCRAARGQHSSPKEYLRRAVVRSERAIRLLSSRNAIFTLLIVLSIAVAAILFIGKQRFEAPGPLAEDKMVNIPRGLGIRDIADLLQREGVIDQPYVFMGSVIALKARGDSSAGEYQFTKQSSVADVVDKITEGKIIQHAVTVQR